MKQIEIDCKWLEKEERMDYSLLIGIHKLPTDSENKTALEDTEKNSGRFLSSDSSELYFMGIIDFLQKYDNKKKAAHFFKAMMDRKRKDELSTVNPTFYASRFIKFMDTQVFSST